MIKKAKMEIDKKIHLLKKLQNDDGGIPAYLASDESGVWCSGEVLCCLLENDIINPCNKFALLISDYIGTSQHKDGGWSYRNKGLSFVDPTCYALIALSYFEKYYPLLIKGIEFLLNLQHKDEKKDDGWGIQENETDRIYSTSKALNALSKLQNHEYVKNYYQNHERLEFSIKKGLEFIRGSKRDDGGWGASKGQESNSANTAHTLQCLFQIGEAPSQHMDSLLFLKSKMKKGTKVFDSVDEIMPLQIGLEVTMQWFTQPEALKTFLYFAESELVDIEEIVELLEGLFSFSIPNSDFVNYAPDAIGKPYTWTIPHYIDGIYKAVRYLENNKELYKKYRKRKEQELKIQKQHNLYKKIQEVYHYPIAESFFNILRETDHLNRFRRMILTVETILVYFSSIAIMAYSHSPKKNHAISTDINENILRPSLGIWHRFLERLINIDITGRGSAILNMLRLGFTQKANLVCEEKWKNLIAALKHFIEIRNKYWGHGAMVSAYEYKDLTDKHLNLLELILENLSFVEKCNLFYIIESEFDEFEEKEIYTVTHCSGLKFNGLRQRIESNLRLSKGYNEPEIKYLYFQELESGSTINLYPLWLSKYCEECKTNRFYSFNLKEGKYSSYFSYECGHFVKIENEKHFSMLQQKIIEDRELF